MEILQLIGGFIGFNVVAIIACRVGSKRQLDNAKKNQELVDRHEQMFTACVRSKRQISNLESEIKEVEKNNKTEVSELEFDLLRKSINLAQSSISKLTILSNDWYAKALPVINERKRLAEIERRKQEKLEAERRAKQEAEDAIRREKERARRRKQEEEEAEERSRRSYSSSSSSSSDWGSSSSSSSDSGYSGGGGDSGGGGSSDSW